MISSALSFNSAPSLAGIGAHAPGIDWSCVDLARCNFGELAAAAALPGGTAASDSSFAVAPLVTDVAVFGLLAHGIRRMLRFIYAPNK